jgi:NADPH-dependent 2,4-dienoyl-CoA reductase/sulfur reductase-like enzyme
MALRRAAFALLALACARAGAAAEGEYRDVCVVGAGPSGVAAALALTQKNKTVALLERLPGVGGQTFPSYTDPASGFRLHMGAVVLGEQDYRIVMGFAKRVGLGVTVRARGPGVAMSALPADRPQRARSRCLAGRRTSSRAQARTQCA